MKLLIFLIFTSLRGSSSSSIETEDLTEMELDRFLEVFNLPSIADPAEKKKRAEILKTNQAKVQEANKAFIAGNQSWEGRINEFSHLTEEEFLSSLTGLAPDNDATSSLASLHMEKMSGNGSLPDSFSSRDKVGPAKYQRCGTCSLFATVALVEVCHAKKLGHRAAYSEQQVLDCSYNGRDRGGCKGGSAPAYARWLQKTKIPLVSDTTYPKPKQPGHQSCKKTLKPLNPRVSVTRTFYAHNYGRNRTGYETEMKRLVVKFGAVGTTIEIKGHHDKYGHYKQGVFDGCPQKDKYHTDHAVAVLGYGTENGTDYWLIRNSWGPKWGDHGYMKMKRGVGMCGIGGSLLTLDCKPDSG